MRKLQMVLVAAALLCAYVFSITVAYGAPITVNIPIRQVFTTTGTYTGAGQFGYVLTPHEQGRAASTFSLTKNITTTSGNLVFDAEGVYVYDLKMDPTGQNPNYTLDSTVYTIEIYVRETSGVLTSQVIIKDASGNKIDAAVFNVSHREVEPRPYTIVYYPGTTDKVYNLPLGASHFADERVVVAVAPTRPGYRFTGYQIERVSEISRAAFTAGIHQPGDSFSMPAADLKATALWQRAWPVTFHPEGGSSVPGQEVDDNGFVVVPTPPTRPGYEFLGWYTADGQPYDFSKPVTGPLDLYAKWRELPKTSPPWMPKTGDIIRFSPFIAILVLGAGFMVIARQRKRGQAG